MHSDKLRIVLLVMLCSASVVSASVIGSEKPTVVILATGGTIAGIGESDTVGSYDAGEVSVEDLIKAVPAIKAIANIRGEQVVNISSEKMNNQIWMKLAKRVNTLLNSDEVDGIVITHGTDTMEETSYFLNLVINSKKPIVFVGAARAATSMSPDGPLNLYNAVAVAASKEAKGKGVLVVLSDVIQGARATTKANTRSVLSFKSPDVGILGYVYYGEISFYRMTTRAHTYQSEFDIADIDSLPTVYILYGYANQHPQLAEAAVRAEPDGIVHAGVGSGGMYPTTETVLDQALEKGIAVVKCAHVGSGRVKISPDESEQGYVSADNLNPKKSRILLMVALTKTKDPKELQRIFFEY
ncbi:MAG: type II asparaginase [bacterium]|nr:type II asparaginase [bacterium]